MEVLRSSELWNRKVFGIYCDHRLRCTDWIFPYTRASCVMSGPLAAAGAWIRKFKEHYGDLQSLRDGRVRPETNLNGELQSLREMTQSRIRKFREHYGLESLRERRVRLETNLQSLTEMKQSLEVDMERERERQIALQIQAKEIKSVGLPYYSFFI